MTLIDTISKNQLLRDGLQFTVSLSESDGTENTDSTSATISIIRNDRNGDETVVNAANMSAYDDSTWKYDWNPDSSVQPGRYIVKFVIQYTADEGRFYDEFEVLQSTHNSIYLSLPNTTTIRKGASKSSSWDNSQRPGTTNPGSNIVS